jgi:hypothetical protein
VVSMTTHFCCISIVIRLGTTFLDPSRRHLRSSCPCYNSTSINIVVGATKSIDTKKSPYSPLRHTKWKSIIPWTD